MDDVLIETAVERETPAAAMARPALAKNAGRPGGIFSLLQNAARNMFGLDYRSLALLRIGIALCLLWVVFINAWEMRAFYTDEGVLPRSVMFDHAGDIGDSVGFSLHLANGGMPYIAALFALQAALALMMVVGYRTRLATVGSYILLLSMQNRQPVLIFGADIALRVGLFWMMFLPLAKRFSLDSLAGRARSAADRPYLGLAGIAFIAQVCMIYTGGALLKTGPTWRVDHTAVAYALALDVYARPLGQWLGQFHWLTKLLTIGTLNFEMFGPLLFILPVFSRWGRLLGIVLFAGLQIGFGLCMTMGIFGGVMIALTLALLPPFFWQRIAGPCGRWLAIRRRAAAMVPASVSAWPRYWIARGQAHNASTPAATRPRGLRYARLVLALFRDGGLAVLLAVMMLWNIGNIPGQRWRLTPALTDLGYAIGLNQVWDMFSPDPQTIDGWFVVAGTLRNGETVNLMTGADPVSFDKPDWVAGSYGSQIWMAYLISFWDTDASSPQLFAQYMGKSWNERHPADEQLASIEINMMAEMVHPGPSKGKVMRLPVWTERF